MPNQVFGFAPPDYGDWASYAGFDRKTGEQVPYQAPTGIAPPESIGEYAQQRTADIQKKFGEIQSKAQKVLPSMNSGEGLSGFDFSINPLLFD